MAPRVQIAFTNEETPQYVPPVGGAPEGTEFFGSASSTDSEGIAVTLAQAAQHNGGVAGVHTYDDGVEFRVFTPKP